MHLSSVDWEAYCLTGGAGGREEWSGDVARRADAAGGGRRGPSGGAAIVAGAGGSRPLCRAEASGIFTNASLGMG